MHRFLFLLVLSFCVTLGAHAQQQLPYSTFGVVEDAFTHHYLDSVNITMLQADSTLVSSTWSYANGSLNFRLYAKQAGRCIIRFAKEGYETLYLPMNLRFSRYRMAQIDLGTIGLRKVRTKKLREAVVKATRIKMVMHGDTLVYDALAFKLVQGSMLDALVRMLPGVELTDGGQIKVNGRAVSSLLVNGENFFRGDPSVALENLPAYTVSKVKVYEQTSEQNRALGLEEHGRKPLVMDVNLKKEYSIGWLANADMGAGTSDRYATRALAMRFSPHSRIYLFGSMNNTNDTRRPGEQGDWKKQEWNPTGLAAIKKGGASLVIRDHLNRFYWDSNLTAEHDDEDNRVMTSTTRFLTGSDAYSRSQSGQTGKSSLVRWNHQLTLTPKWSGSSAYISLSPTVEYRTYTNSSASRFATFSANPAESRRGAALDSLFAAAAPIGSALWVNRQQQTEEGSGHSFYTAMEMGGSIRYNRHLEDLIRFGGGADYRNQADYSHQISDLRYRLSATSDDLRRQYARQPLRYFSVWGNAAYDYKFTIQRNHITLTPYYNYHLEYRHSDRPLYRLERLGGLWAQAGLSAGALPSTQDSLALALDAGNSYYSSEHNRRQEAGLSVLLYRNPTQGYSDDLDVQLRLPFSFRHQQLSYARTSLDTLLCRHFTFFEPSLTIDKKLYEDAGQAHQRNLEFSYRLSMASPPLTSLLPIRDDASPLFVSLGNDLVRNSRTHLLSAGYRASSQPCNGYLTAGIDYQLTEAAFCQAITYDRATGVTTLRPDNINGNWRLQSHFYLTRTLDRRKRFTLSTTLSANYTNSVDRTLSTDHGGSNRSTVHDTQLNERISLSYRYFTLSSEVRGTFANSRREGFTAVHCADIIHGLSVNMPLPLHFQLATDLTLYNRRGYEDHTMNTNQWIWNAQLSRSLMKGRMQVMLQGYDLLGQLKGITRSLNAQGRVETWRNSIPRYVMLHLTYRLRIIPRERKTAEPQ